MSFQTKTTQKISAVRLQIISVAATFCCLGKNNQKKRGCYNCLVRTKML